MPPAAAAAAAAADAVAAVAAGAAGAVGAVASAAAAAGRVPAAAGRLPCRRFSTLFGTSLPVGARTKNYTSRKGDGVHDSCPTWCHSRQEIQ